MAAAGPAPWARLLALLALLAGSAALAQPERDTWAVIVSTSRYWLNYRHTSNALGVYRAIKR